MRRFVAFIGIGLAAVLAAHAESRLFPTDILASGEIDARFAAFHDTHSDSISARGNPGRSSVEIDAEVAQVRYGMGANWQIGLTLPYYSTAEVKTEYDRLPTVPGSTPRIHRVVRAEPRTDQPRVSRAGDAKPPAHIDTSAEGGQNPILSATYGLVTDKASPFSLSGELAVSPNTTGRVDAIYSGRLLAGWKTSGPLWLYGGLTATSSPDVAIPASQRISLGAFLGLSKSVVIVPQAAYTRFQATDALSSLDQIGFSLSANILLTPDTRLIPSIGFYRNGKMSSKDGVFQREATDNGRVLQLGIYQFF